MCNKNLTLKLQLRSPAAVWGEEWLEVYILANNFSVDHLPAAC